MLKDYVVMKAVEGINGKRGKSSLHKLLKGSKGSSTSKMAADFGLTYLWGIFSRLSNDEMENIFTDLSNKGYICTEDVQLGSYNYPMLFITEEGRNRLSDLEDNGAQRLKDFKAGQHEAQVYLEITDRGIILDGFVKLVVSFLNQWNSKANSEADFTEIMDLSGFLYEDKSWLEKFFYSQTPEKFKDHWRAHNIMEITCFELNRNLRLFLGSLSELEALVFRVHYNLQDPFLRSVEEVLDYYRLPGTELQNIIKRIISRFSSISYIERFVFIQDIVEIANTMSVNLTTPVNQLTKDTSEVTYDLFLKGMSLVEIARERGLAVSTIYNHFIKLIPKYNIELDRIVTHDRLSAIVKAAEDHGDEGLKAIKEKLPYDYNYGEIKLVLELQEGWEAA